MLFIFLVFCVVIFALFVFELCLVYPMWPVSVDCLLLHTPLRFSLNFIAIVLYILNTFHNLAFFYFFFNINLCVVTKHFTKDSHLTGKHQVALYEYVLMLYITCRWPRV